MKNNTSIQNSDQTTLDKAFNKKPSNVDKSSPSSQPLTFHNIRFNGEDDIGQFRTLKSKFGWRISKLNDNINTTSNKMLQLDSSDISSVEWVLTSPKSYCLRIEMKNQDLLRFDGFRPNNYDMLREHIETFWNTSIKLSNNFSKGWHWGYLENIKNKYLKYSIENQTIFEMLTNRIQHVEVVKDDLTFQIKNEDKKIKMEDQIMELSFYVPTDSEGNEVNNIISDRYCGLGHSSKTPSSIICSFVDVKMLIPSGRFDIQLYQNSMKFSGKSHNFTVDYKNVTQMYLLPSESLPQTVFILVLDVPIRKGHTTYLNVMFQFDTNKYVTLDILKEFLDNQDHRDTFEKYRNSTEEVDSEIESEIVPLMMKTLIGKPLIIPDTFKSKNKQCYFRSSYKANSGTIYPMRDVIIFIPKPLIIIKYEDITSLNFERIINSQTKLCSFFVTCKDGNVHTFNSVDRDEAEPFCRFLQSKKVTVQSLRDEIGIGRSYGEAVNTQFDLDSDSSTYTEEDESDDSDDTDEDYDDDEECNSKLKNKAENKDSSDNHRFQNRKKVRRV